MPDWLVGESIKYHFDLLVDMVKVHSATVKVIQNGRITIPTDIRECEDIKLGDFLFVTFEKMAQPARLPKD